MRLMQNNYNIPISLAEKSGCAALLFGFLLLLLAPGLAAIPLLTYLFLCLGAPFFPRFSFFLPIISRGKPGSTGIALTFDDGPSPASTPILLELLARYDLQATFFVVGEKAAKHPQLIKDILAQGHTIGNHSWRHDPMLMLRAQGTLQKDIHNTQEILKKSGVQPLVFRPPAGITGPRLHKVLAREGLTTIAYSCRALDRGNRNIHNLTGKILKRLRPGAIVLLHDLPPQQQTQVEEWINELERLFTALEKKYTVVALEELIQRRIHITLSGQEY